MKTINDKLIQESVNKAISDFKKRHSLAEAEKHYRSQLCKCVNEKEDVMKRYFGISSNGCKPFIVEKVTIDRIIGKHGDNGFVCVSACRGDKSDEQNEAATKSLLSDISKGGWSFLPTYGGYRNTDTGEEGDYEASFTVFNYGKDGNPRDFKELAEFARLMCGKYGQDCVLVKAPNKAAVYVDKDGRKVNSTESDKVWKNDPSKEFFTSISSKEHKENMERQYGKPYHHRRWTNDIQFESVRVNPIPCTLNERIRRRGMGEVMLY